MSDSFKHPWSEDFDRRYAYSRQSSFRQQQEPRSPVSFLPNESLAKPFLSRTSSSIDMPPEVYNYSFNYHNDDVFGDSKDTAACGRNENFPAVSLFRAVRYGSRQMRRLCLMIFLNVAYSTTEFVIGLFSGRIGLVSDAFHLTFGCGLLTFSLFAMAASRRKPNHVYTYGYKRLEVLAAFTNALFLLFLSFSLAVEALHAFIQDESEHKHYLVVSAVTNLAVNLIGVWFFRNYARVNIVYRNAEDMNYHSVCLHVLADSIRRVKNAEVLCLGLVSVTVFMLVMPLFKAAGGVLLQTAPPSIPPSALSKCSRQISACEDVSQVSEARFWELVPGHAVGSISLQVRNGTDDRQVRSALAIMRWMRNRSASNQLSSDRLRFLGASFPAEECSSIAASTSIPHSPANISMQKYFGIMTAEEENPPSSTLPAESSASVPEDHIMVDAIPVQPIIPPVMPPAAPFVPTMAPLPTITPPIPRPLAPLPIRPPVLKPPAPQDGEAGTSDSDSEEDDSSLAGTGLAVGYEISEESRIVRERQQKAIQELMMKRRAAALAVPTNDMAVRARLRRLGEPITLFGEREMERRDRLRMLMAKLDSEGQLEKLMKAHEEEEAAATTTAYDAEEEMVEYPFYTEGSRQLLDARISIAKYSIARAASRLQRARRKRDDPDEDEDAEIKWALEQAGSLALDCSEFGDDRPLSGCSISKDGEFLATCSLTGVAKVWKTPQINKISALKGHKERLTDVTFSPVNNYLATASADRTAKLWDTDGTLLRTFEGHLDRLARISFHPSGKYIGTTSFDKTWRLWDVDTGVELLLQEGHSRSVYGIAFHHDGSLVGSCGLDALARVWDLRTGRSIMALEGHVKPVLGISFSPNGYHLATGGEDNTCRIWDLRKKKSLYVIPAHSNLVSDVKFEPQEGYYLVTASYDTTAKVWSGKDFKPVKTLAGHESKVTSLDIAPDGRYIATVSHDRTIKLWSSRSNEKEGMDVD
ncbi:U4/U6 small nuclear ribonucleoprotein PRP4-like protein [Linum perenne]